MNDINEIMKLKHEILKVVNSKNNGNIEINTPNFIKTIFSIELNCNNKEQLDELYNYYLTNINAFSYINENIINYYRKLKLNDKKLQETEE